MAKEDTVKAIAKVIIAAAWVDGEISNEEINSLKDLLFQLPDMNATDWSELEIYMDSPVGESERERLLLELNDRLSTHEDRALAAEALEKVLSADGEFQESERKLLEEVKPRIENGSSNLIAPLSKLIRGSTSRRSQQVSQAPNREAHLDDFVNNKIFFLVNNRLGLDEKPTTLTEEKLRKLCLAGGMMARVLYVDREVSQAEFDGLARILEEKWSLTQYEAAVVAESAVNEITKGMDLYRLSRQFFELSDEAERVRFLDVLFAAADGDGFVTYDETEEIRLISKMLKLTHQQFITAKLKIPSDRRSS